MISCAALVLVFTTMLIFRVDVPALISRFMLLTLTNRRLRGSEPREHQSDDAVQYPTNSGGSGGL